ncbi:helicase-related protein [Halomonas daqiaonensis]|uniref:Helicase conserved C-terminal domain-containing protein n=1 Tax=Halomonas daqiaonensis TaxID=650850 RepID=A0A1H7P081_9GAMM|nr:helicase-related protein [Halomonas daqiaonensis]SEL29046.1 Helicase conserved C-terminal domain-containing protein [Halomonas daqiaonensis]
MSAEPFRAAPALAPLKTFQRRTVDYVFERLHGASDPARHFLVADEVGLGKTMVARGVIARTIEHLWDRVKRIDILYICSNQAIAAQNINRLNVLGRQELALPTRMTLVPLQMRNGGGLEANKVNFISLTPGTTFDLRSTTGVVQERALLFHLLEPLVPRRRGLLNLLQVTAGVDGWNREVENLTLEGIDSHILDRFRREVQADPTLLEELKCLCERFPRRRRHYPAELTQPRNSLVARLRAKLSHACVDALQPDLIIMDEFQRFRELLHGKNDAALLARELFDYTDRDGNAARTLLLSATPYRMLTLADDDPEEGDHYQDFIETLGFLFGRNRGSQMATELDEEMRAFRQFLHALPDSYATAVEARGRVERKLRQVIARTERVKSTQQRDSMVTEPKLDVVVEPADLQQAAAASEVARALGAPEIIEYWKSAPYLLNFMRDYSLKRLLREAIDSPSTALRVALKKVEPALLNRRALNTYRRLEPANGRMRALMRDMFDQRLEAHLWIPPALPYYGPKQAERPTKALVFSAWQMVPDAIAALLSYEAERRMNAGEDGRRYFDRHRRRPLRFSKDQGRLTGLRTLMLVYPATELARITDPLAVFAENQEILSLESMRTTLAKQLRSDLAPLQTPAHKDDDERDINWAVPALIDRLSGSHAPVWMTGATGLSELAAEDAFSEHVDELNTVSTQVNLGLLSDELIDLLVDVALGSPAICGLRALHRIAPDLDWDDSALLEAASRIGWGFRTLLNQRDAVALLRRGADDRYWHRVLTYCAEHNLQAVLDEYAHYLVDAEGLAAHPSAERVIGVANAMVSALSIRPSQIDVDHLQRTAEGYKLDKFQMRGRFAMRLADYRDEEGVVARVGGVRDAFNSPFRPFVLATTSVGQEGLDFHPYCYRVYHWNLPGNPVDLEQREGRVHRFKGHAVRLNLAWRQGNAIRRRGCMPDDPWEVMFDQARAESDTDTGLVPYWVYEGPVKVERRVPMLPFSREVTRLGWLKRSLTVYRLAFGQPRQDDLLEYLQQLMDTDIPHEALEDLQIQLEPRMDT